MMVVCRNVGFYRVASKATLNRAVPRMTDLQAPARDSTAASSQFDKPACPEFDYLLAIVVSISKL